MADNTSEAREETEEPETNGKSDAEIIDISDMAESEVPSAVLDLIEACWKSIHQVKVERRYSGESWVYLRERIPITQAGRAELDPESIALRAVQHARDDLAKVHKKRIDGYRLEVTMKPNGRKTRRYIRFRVKARADGGEDLIPHRSEDERDLIGQLRSMLTDQHDMTMRSDEAAAKIAEALAKVADKMAETMTAAAGAIAATGAHGIAKAAVEADAAVETERIRSRARRQEQGIQLLATILPTAMATWAAVNGSPIQTPGANTTQNPSGGNDGGRSGIAGEIGQWLDGLPGPVLEKMRETIGERGVDYLEAARKAETDDDAKAILYELREFLMADGGAKVKQLGSILGPHALALTSILSRL